MSDSSKWENLSLLKKLERRDKEFVLDTVDSVAVLINNSPLGLETFVAHDIDHCYRVARRVGEILPEIKPNMAESLSLLYAIICHDIGMWTKQKEIYKAMRDDEFEQFAKKDCGAETLKKISNLLESEDNKWIGERALQVMVAHWDREYHPKRSADIIRNGDIIKISEKTKNILEIIARIIEAHGWDSDRVRTDPYLDRTIVVTEGRREPVNVRYLAFLLRLGDLLDIGEARIPYLLWEYLNPLPAESEAHWKMVQNLQIGDITPDKIEIFKGEFCEDAVGIRSRQLAEQWMGYIKVDIENLHKVCNNPEQYRVDDRPKIGKLNLKVTVGNKLQYIEPAEVEALKCIYDSNLDLLEQELKNLTEVIRIAKTTADLDDVSSFLQDFKPLLEYFKEIYKEANVANWKLRNALKKYVYLCNKINELHTLPVKAPLLEEIKYILGGSRNV